MTPAQKAVIERNYSVGRHASNILEATGELHAEREEQLLSEMIVWFENQPWDERTAVRYIASLVENRRQKETLEYRAKKGFEARAKLFQTPPTAEE